jgi:hypothetical protein
LEEVLREDEAHPEAEAPSAPLVVAAEVLLEVAEGSQADEVATREAEDSAEVVAEASKVAAALRSLDRLCFSMILALGREYPSRKVDQMELDSELRRQSTAHDHAFVLPGEARYKMTLIELGSFLLFFVPGT